MGKYLIRTNFAFSSHSGDNLNAVQWGWTSTVSRIAESKPFDVLWHITGDGYVFGQRNWHASGVVNGKFHFKHAGGDDVQQLCDAGEEEFLEIMALVGMATKPLHVRRFQKSLAEWVSNPSAFQTPLPGIGKYIVR